jgi:hypothetical protein
MKFRIIFILLTSQTLMLGCYSRMTEKEKIKQALGNITDEDLAPHYKTIYTPKGGKTERYI